MKTHLRKFLIFSIVTTFLFGCSGVYKSTLTPGHEIPQGHDLAVSYLDHPDVTVSNKATEVLESELRKCNKNDFIEARIVDSILSKHNITIPRRITSDFIKSLKNVIPTKYLLTGGVSIWVKGSVGSFPFGTNSNTQIAASFTIYDLASGEVVWTVSGQDEGASGIFSEDPARKAPSVFKQMLKKWEKFCSDGVKN
ncbi:MAG: hypothetical protein HY033_11110 [Ignavibacteriae bacterium]|nr:hypothetical protein [Ignavibacteria bacterium]MBI3365447.1 hypothetical protein [Ignavibacteriota bacterium]